jgi:hypothetical protein
LLPKPGKKLKGDRFVQSPEYSFNRKTVNANAPKLASNFLKVVFRKISLRFKLINLGKGDGNTTFDYLNAAAKLRSTAYKTLAKS